MASYDYGKNEIVAWIRNHFSPDATVLDVGACDGKWKDLLPEFEHMDAIEIFEPNIEEHKLREKYSNVIYGNIVGYKYWHYDLVIFGDVIEHLSVKDAKKVINYARVSSHDYIIGVPWQYEQGELYGNIYEKHIQDDLTKEIFNQRYPGNELILDLPEHGYAYYHKGEK